MHSDQNASSTIEVGVGVFTKFYATHCSWRTLLETHAWPSTAQLQVIRPVFA